MKKQKLSRVGALLLALVVAVSMIAPAFAAEGDGEGGGETESPPAQTTPSVSISPVQGNSILLGDQIVLTATIKNLPENVSEDEVALIWTCSNETKLAFVNPNEKETKQVTVRGAEVGTAQISVRITVDGKNYYDYLTLAIEYAPALDMELTASGIYFNGSNYTLSKEPGNTWSITANVVPANASPNATWTTSDESVVMLTENTALGGSMNFKAVNPGIATITATVGSVTKSCVVTVSGLAIKETNGKIASTIELPVGETHSLTYEAFGQSLSDSQLAVEWSSSNSNVATINVSNGGKNVTITAVNEGTASISITSSIYTSTCYVTVVPNLAEDISTNVPDMVLNFSDPITLKLGSSTKTNTSIIDAIKQNCAKVTQSSLNYVSGLSVSTSQGTLYYGYKSEGDTGSGVGGMERYYTSETYVSGLRTLSGITFVPKPDFSGTATVSYTGYASNGKTFTGKILLNVSVVEDVAYTTTVNTPVPFKGADFSNVCTEKNGRGLSSVTFNQPTKGEGAIYYNYTGSSQTEAVSSGTSYFTTRAPYINSLSFVPATGFTGTVEIPYKAVDNAGTKYEGTVTIVVIPTAGEANISYSSVAGETIEFKLGDFTRACTSVLGADSELNYVVFTLPPSSEGILSYSYKSGNKTYGGNLVAGDRFYRSSSTKPLSSVRFTAGDKASGAVLINFDGYDTGGKHFSGTVRVYVGNEGDGGTVEYSSTNGAPVKFDSESFNELCQRSIKEALDYVTFTLPSSMQGAMFYNYNNSYLTGTAVSEGTKYYRSGSSLISNITFVPNLSFSGIVSIGFTAYGVNGGHFIGAVVISVSAPSDRTISYNVLRGEAVKFSTSDFSRLCQIATGKELNYVRFSVPSSMKGTLCYNYNGENGTYASKVNSGTSYYRANSGQLIENISYLSETGGTGTVQMSFDGWSVGGSVFSGLVEINVAEPVAKTITYAGNSLAFDLVGSDLSGACLDLTGKRLDYIEFNSLPGASAGTLYTSFSGPMEHGEAARTGVKYYISGTPSIDGLAFLPKADYDDIVTLTYTGVDVSGTSYTGTIQMAINNYGTSGYSDMGSHSWAEGAVNFLTVYGVVNGTGGNNFTPAQPIRRADYMMMICRAFRLNTGNRTGFNDVSPDSYYAWAVSTAKDMGIAQGDGSNFYPETSLTREDAMVLLQRTLNVVGQGIGNGSESYLNGFSDAGNVSNYARGAVAAMVQRGLITGDGENRLNPKQPMSRAEMAVFLHRVLTM